jgi:hypothetical protein
LDAATAGLLPPVISDRAFMKRDMVVFLVMSVLLFSTPLWARLLQKLGWPRKVSNDEQDNEKPLNQHRPHSSVNRTQK